MRVVEGEHGQLRRRSRNESAVVVKVHDPSNGVGLARVSRA